ncbi:uncharacterized protein BDCG_17242 [Blastomyces dermatitidis ER-3]|uniref:Uncharacterized protein n=1 Tax=Ajellomyces dermatitidis (strain ER-3 / ATCC MYA-2586) TaxID=559297 RepID=A0ABX2VXD4_AJEDR|nr:uncharacterized protein BDCG_17242 [Blastomyces dermatitidis ER-3]OAT01809.1 hypothetical protein BDCG_17242 [Blastomyces dermatitidis ER-3]
MRRAFFIYPPPRCSMLCTPSPALVGLKGIMLISRGTDEMQKLKQQGERMALPKVASRDSSNKPFPLETILCKLRISGRLESKRKNVGANREAASDF